MAELKLPASEDGVRALKVGDFVELTGRMITGRDAAHKWLIEEYRDEVAPYLEGTVIYHCGPVVSQTTAAGSSWPPDPPPRSARSPTRPM